MQSAENRKNPRSATPNILVRISTRERFRHSYLKDLSEGGLFVKTDKPLPPGRTVTVDLLPPGWTDPLRLTGTVVRNGGEGTAGMGIKFEGVDDHSLEALSKLLSEYTEAVDEGHEPMPPPPEGALRASGGDPGQEQVLALQERLAQRESELEVERGKFAQAQRQLSQLLAEAQMASSPSSTGETAQALHERTGELAEARARLAEVEGELAAFKEELAVLESDDASSRKLAATLAKDKTTLTQELTRTREAAATAANAHAEALEALKTQVASKEAEARGNEEAFQEQVRSAEAASAKHKASAEQLAHTAAQLESQVTQTAAALTRVSAELNDAQSDAATAQSELKAAHAEAQTLRDELSQLRNDGATSGRRVAALEQQVKDLTAKNEKLKEKERELRDLIAAAVTTSPEEAPVSQPPPSRAAPPEPARAPAAAVPAEDGPLLQSSASVYVSIDEDGRDEAPAPDASMVRPQSVARVVEESLDDWGSQVFDGGEQTITVEEESIPAPPAPISIHISSSPLPQSVPESMASSEGFDVSLDEDVDLGDADSSLPRTEFEARLRRNAALAKLKAYSSYVPKEPLERTVMDLLKESEHMSKLMVAGRGIITPAQLVDVLYTLHQAGVVGYAEP